MRFTILICIAFALLSGCKSTRISKDLTAGQIGCSPKDIKIVDETARAAGTHTWTAVCKGAEYVCSYHATTGAKCTPKQ